MTPMALTLHQPWASLVALGVKTIETRSWSTDYRGPLLIHAGKARPDFRSGAIREACAHHGIGCWERRPDAIGGTWLCCVDDTNRVVPRGAIVASCTLADVVPITKPPKPTQPGLDRVFAVEEGVLRDWRRSDLAGYPGWVGTGDGVTEDQRPYGDFAPGRFAWLLEDVKATTERCPACWGEGVGAVCPSSDGTRGCDGSGVCDPIPAKGHQRLWRWTP